MSNWITDNKPAAMVAGVGLLLFLGLSATGYIVNSKRSELDKKISIAAKEIKSANAAEITPCRSSNEDLEKELNRYAKAVNSLETAYKPFLASSALVPTTPTAFQNELKTFRDSLISSCKKKNILITDTSNWLGFQVYSTQAPSVQAASTLGFELKAINSLVNKLKECGLSKFIKVYRPQLPIETPANNPEESDEADQSPWTPMPLEIAFQGDRESVLNAINAITGMQDYL
ncbi:Amuc_1100 family pilus-like protein, partial [uncultured Akkermansia sp.]